MLYQNIGYYGRVICDVNEIVYLKNLLQIFNVFWS